MSRNASSLPHPPRERRRAGWMAIQLLATAALMVVYHVSGASEHLASGASRIAGGTWWLRNLLYLGLTFFGYAAVLFPLRYVCDQRLSPPDEDPVEFGPWLEGYGRSLLLDLALGLFFFSLLYALLRALPEGWWLGASLLYLVYALGFQWLIPGWMTGRLVSTLPVYDVTLAEQIEQRIREAGLQPDGVFVQEAEDPENKGQIWLTGIGRKRRVMLSPQLIRHFKREEIEALTLREIGHVRISTPVRLTVMDFVLAMGALFAASRLYLWLFERAYGTGVPLDHVAAFPLLACSLLFFQALTLPVGNAVSRRHERAVDEYAARQLPSAKVLLQALSKVADLNHIEKRPPLWLEWLWYASPSMHRRARYLHRRSR